ncbi:hypothetical protein NVP1246O_40 [Vibrio phage 1.246.O._10N.261.54.E10]|nr:hypothetical protein NVP1246O_40 [Vibrio phage 1.246.O._10N.261.54.E10]
MAYSPSEKYPGAVDVDPDYQGGKFRDNNPSTTNNGSPLKAIDRNELLARDEAIMNDAGFEYNGLPDTPQDSQLFKAYKASLGNGANLLSNHNFLIQTPDDSQPLPSATPTSYPPGHQIFSGVFANETTGITNLTYIDGRVSFSGGDLYFAVPNAGGIERLTEFAASVADFDGKPRQMPNTSWSLVGGEYRVSVGVADLAGVPIGSVKFEQGSVATRHDVIKSNSDIIDLFIGFVMPDSTVSAMRDFAFLADGAEYNRADYPKLWSIVSNSPILVSQSLINGDPETYAANYGDGDGSTTFTLPNYGLRPHLAAAGAFGAVGSTVEDHIQNITGRYGRVFSTGGGVSPDGAFSADESNTITFSGTATTLYQGTFDASRVARTSTYTEVNSSFLNFYIIHGEAA